MGKVPMSKVSDLRKGVGLTQRQLADAVGVTESTIANWEKNRNGVEWLERVARLCRTLKCSPDDLIGYKELLDDEETAS